MDDVYEAQINRATNFQISFITRLTTEPFYSVITPNEFNSASF